MSAFTGDYPYMIENLPLQVEFRRALAMEDARRSNGDSFARRCRRPTCACGFQRSQTSLGTYRERRGGGIISFQPHSRPSAVYYAHR